MVADALIGWLVSVGVTFLWLARRFAPHARGRSDRCKQRQLYGSHTPGLSASTRCTDVSVSSGVPYAYYYSERGEGSSEVAPSAGNSWSRKAQSV